MTWVFINHLIIESRQARSCAQQKLRSLCLIRQDVVKFEALASYSPRHRTFGGVADIESGGDAFFFRAPSADIVDFCTSFSLSGLHTKVSDVALLVEPRQFFASWRSFNFLRTSSGHKHFFLGSVRQVHFFFSLFLKTRALLFLSAWCYNVQRFRVYIWSLPMLLASWQLTYVPTGLTRVSAHIVTLISFFTFSFFIFVHTLCFMLLQLRNGN